MFQESSVFGCEEEQDESVPFTAKPVESFHLSAIRTSVSTAAADLQPKYSQPQQQQQQQQKHQLPSQAQKQELKHLNQPLTNLLQQRSVETPPRNGPYMCGVDSLSDAESVSTSPAPVSKSDAQSQNSKAAAPHQTLSDEAEEQQFVDEFGFVIDEEAMNREALYVKNVDGKQVMRREVKWATMASDWANVNGKKHTKLKERCRKGIPAAFRGIAWQLLVGSHKEMADPANRSTYDLLCRKPLTNSEVDHIIGRDLSRTFPNHVLFREVGGVGQTFLKNVLHAYACADPEVGYVQGMGFVVGTLSTQMGEEETFWALLNLMNDERYNLRELYRPGFPMLQQFFFQLKKLMERLLPKLYSHFERMEVDPSFYASQWFLTLFVYHFQFRALLRIWDIFMSEAWKVIFRVAIALMKWEERRLLTLSFDQLLPALKELHEGKDPDEIVRRAHNVKFKTSELRVYGEEYWNMKKVTNAGRVVV